MPQVWFEPTILEFERAKTARALGRAATVIGLKIASKRKCFIIPDFVYIKKEEHFRPDICGDTELLVVKNGTAPDNTGRMGTVNKNKSA
jgi:hypothetical protein